MAGFVGYRKTAWDNASAPQKAVLRTVLNNLGLGSPVLYDNGSGVQWYVFHDARINSRFVENLAWLNEQIASFTTSPDRDYPTTEIVQVEVPVYVEEERVDPETGETYTVLVDSGTTQLVDQEQALGDPLTLAAGANSTANWFNAATNLPDGWTPVDPEA